MPIWMFGGVIFFFRCCFCFGGGERDLQVSEGISPGVGGGVVRHGEGGLVGEGLEIERCCAAVGVLFVEGVHLFKGRLEGRAGEVAKCGPVGVVTLVPGTEEGVGAEGCDSH